MYEYFSTYVYHGHFFLLDMDIAGVIMIQCLDEKD